MTTPIAPAHPVVAAIKVAAESIRTGSLAELAVLDAIDPSVQPYAERSLTIGGSWNPDVGAYVMDQAVVVETAERGAGRLPVELVAVQCVAYAGSGDGDLSVHRAGVGEILTAFAAALRAVTTVGGASARLRIAEQQWAQGIDEKGSFVIASVSIMAEMLP